MNNTTVPIVLIAVEFIVILVLSAISSERGNTIEELRFELNNTQSVYEDYAEELQKLKIDFHELEKEYNRLQEALTKTESECLRLRKVNLQNKHKNK